MVRASWGSGLGLQALLQRPLWPGLDLDGFQEAFLGAVSREEPAEQGRLTAFCPLSLGRSLPSLNLTMLLSSLDTCTNAA